LSSLTISVVNNTYETRLFSLRVVQGQWYKMLAIKQKWNCGE